MRSCGVVEYASENHFTNMSLLLLRLIGAVDVEQER